MMTYANFVTNALLLFCLKVLVNQAHSSFGGLDEQVITKLLTILTDSHAVS